MKMLAHDCLITSRRILRDMVAADALIRSGHEAKGRALLARLASEATAELPVLDGVLAAQGQAAQAVNLTQGPAVRLGVQPHEHPHAANDHATTSEQPASPVA